MTTHAHQNLGIEDDLSFPNVPPFPDNVPTAPLYRLSLSSLRTSAKESQRLFAASTSLGFFYLDLRSDFLGEALLREADQLFDFAPRLFRLGRVELSKYSLNVKNYFGYKGIGDGVVDEKGTSDRNEFFNIPKDFLLDQSLAPFPHPMVLAEHKPCLKSYAEHNHALVLFLLTHLENHLKLPASALTSLHNLASISGDHIRLVSCPPQPSSDLGTALGKHTDYGSLTVLFNRLGGLQILPPGHGESGGAEEWLYVKPLRGHCIINLGDALVKFTRGTLKSNLHRVIEPPGEQRRQVRLSLVYFSRPGDEVVLKALDGGAVPEGEDEEGLAAKDWILSQAAKLSMRKGPTRTNEEKLIW